MLKLEAKAEVGAWLEADAVAAKLDIAPAGGGGAGGLVQLDQPAVGVQKRGRQICAATACVRHFVESGLGLLFLTAAVRDHSQRLVRTLPYPMESRLSPHRRLASALATLRPELV